MEGAGAIAAQLANGPASLSMIRRAYWATWHNAYEQQLDLEAQLQAEAGRTRDYAEGVRGLPREARRELRRALRR